MRAVILAAGEGKRMHPLTTTQPKVMLPVANRPILEHLLLEIKQAGIADFLFVVGYHAGTVREHFGNGHRWGVSIDYVTQRNQLGTGHAVKTVEGLVEERFLLANGDIIVEAADIARLLARQEVCLSLIEVTDTTDLGVVEVAGDRIVRIHEKASSPPTRLANAGVYLLTSEIFKALGTVPRSPRGEYELPDALQHLADCGQPVTYEMIQSWLNLSYPWDLLDANEKLLDSTEAENNGTVEANVTVNGKVSVGKGTVLHSGTYIRGPVVIGENCHIGPNCFIRASTAIGNNCHIGGSVEIKNSIIMNGARVPHLSYVGDSVIAQNCNLGAGTMIANLRFDHKDISVGGVSTHRQKFGAVVGANVQTGVNACINAGSMIGNDCCIGPGASVGGTVLPDSTIM